MEHGVFYRLYKLMFSFRGFIPRSKFIFGILLLVPLFILSFMLCAMLVNTISNNADNSDMPFFISLLICLISMLAILTKRLHDAIHGFWIGAIALAPILLYGVPIAIRAALGIDNGNIWPLGFAFILPGSFLLAFTAALFMPSRKDN